jgi:hypothetical protein
MTSIDNGEILRGNHYDLDIHALLKCHFKMGSKQRPFHTYTLGECVTRRRLFLTELLNEICQQEQKYA